MLPRMASETPAPSSSARAWIAGLLRAAAVNAVPVWGFTQEQWSAGTILALFWFQTAASIPVTVLLIAMHRRLTRKAGHYAGNTTLLKSFATMAIPFAIAHGIFLVAILGLLWKDRIGAVDSGDLREGAKYVVGLLALGLVADMSTLRHQSFAWIQGRATGLMQRTALVHFVIIIGMAAAAFAHRDAETFFTVFLGLKLVFDVMSEMPQWSPQEAPDWMTWLAKRMRPDSDFAKEWQRMAAQQRENAVLAERTLEELEAARPPR